PQLINQYVLVIIYFFSSRRRHTRFSRDWSSDVCSSDLWAGHLGLKLAYKLLPIIKKSKTTIIFINTRGQSEMWYQHLLNLEPERSEERRVGKECRTGQSPNEHGTERSTTRLIICALNRS